MRPCPVTTLSLTEPLPRPLTCCRSDAPKQCADFCPPLLPSTTGHEKKHPCFGTKRLLVCCLGWKQQGTECPVAICEGADTCQPEEVCIRPGVCRCKPGFFGANCNSHCPSQYWGPDCKEVCTCHPNGKCDPATGQCTCNHNRWGHLCQYMCQCGPQGKCNPLTGSCQCDPGWWSSTCKKQCQCNPNSARCHSATGQCICAHGWWGLRCSFRCICSLSPCAQSTGKCECKDGWWGLSCENQCDCLHGKCSPVNGHCNCEVGFQGTSCRDPCTAGYYGPRCRTRCGHCRENQPCSPKDGFCLSCESGWNGTRCDQLCQPGYYGENCAQICPRCRQGEECNPETGTCQNCEPGMTGPRCDSPCPAGTFGDQCLFSCPNCGNGSCIPVSGECVCEPGFWGVSCNETCPRGLFGVNCSSNCECHGAPCSPHSGQYAQHYGALIAGILLPLLLLLLLLCCCWCCRSRSLDSKDRAADSGAMSGVKHHFQGMVADLSAMCPCTSMGSSRLSWVTVSHHDTEIPINHSFIESPSTGWDNESFSSFDTDEGDPVYCTPPQEEITEVARGEFQEISSKCNVFPGASAFNEDDISEPFSIPRTSSNAKAKRPSVSFAEGTKFAPEFRRGSTTETSNLARKPKLPWGLPKLSLVQSNYPMEEANPQPDEQIYECAEPSLEQDDDQNPSTRSTSGGRRRTLSSAQKAAQRAVTGEDNSSEQKVEGRMKIPRLTTIYVNVGPIGKPSKPAVNIEGEGPVKSVLRRFGSLQRAKLGHKDEPKLRNSVDGIQKPVRKSLLQAALKASSATPSNTPQNEVLMQTEKPQRSNRPHTAKPLDTKKPLVPTSSVLKKPDLNAEEGAETLDNADSLDKDADKKPEGIPPPLQVNELDRQGQTICVADEDSEPKYENICHPGNNQLTQLQPTTDVSDT
ncbi:scavenger receptor class F member 1 isoform X2 [Pleurodeles waltl]|uniref:scavenger receptor class F member 1 isoform X2 n=1 Tax=Pleurodeles waltl TaxID=8319 RepID=UPI0037097EFE